MATSKTKNSMIVPHEWLKALDKMSDEDAGKLMKALLLLDSEGITTEFDQGSILDIIYAQYSTYVMRNKEAYMEECRRRSEAAKRREAQKAQLCTKSTTVHDKEKDKEKDNNIYTCSSDTKVSTEEQAPDISEEDIQRITDTWNRQGDIVVKIGFKIKPMTGYYDELRRLLATIRPRDPLVSPIDGLLATINSLNDQEWFVQRYKEMGLMVDFKWFIDPVNYAHVKAGKYKTVFKKNSKTPNKFKNFDERSYDWDELEATLTGG